MKQHAVSEDLVLCENAIYLPGLKALVIADLQLGYEQQLRSLGHNITYEQAKKMLASIEALIATTGAEKLIIDGDLKHNFGKTISKERQDITTLLQRLRKRVDIIVVKGNHDTMTKYLLDDLQIPLHDHFTDQGFLFMHGHLLPAKDMDMKNIHTIIIGHAHPAISLNDGVRNELCKCFVIGKFLRKRLVMIPSFSTIAEGTNILNHNGFSPFLTDLESCRVYALADEILDFGTIKQLRKALDKAKS